jgi:hypothetical protein
MSASVFVELKANIAEFQAKMGEARTEMTKLQKHGEGTVSQISALGKGTLVGLATAAVGIGAISIDAADREQTSQKQLQAALKASGQSWDKVKDSVKTTGDQATKYGFTQAQVDQALTTGVISTQNYSKAHDNLQVAIQLAAARHVDLNTAMQAVDKAATGQTRALKQLGIDLPITAGGAKAVQTAQDALAKAQANVNAIIAKTPDAVNPASKAHAAYEAAVAKVDAAHQKLAATQAAGNNILDALRQRLSGQADAAASTFAGRLAAMKAQGENLFATIGAHLIPVLSKLMAITLDVVKWFEKHRTVAIALGIALGTVVAAAIGVYIAGVISATIATLAMAIEVTEMGVAAAAAWLMALGPIGLVIAAVAAVIAIIVLVVTHWQTVLGWFKEGWNVIRGLFMDGVEWIKSHWELLVAILTGPIGLAVLFIKDHWNTIRRDVSQLITDITTFFTGLPAKIVAGLGDLVGTIWGTLKNTVSWLDTNVWQPVSSWFVGLPGKIASAIGSGIGAVAGVGKSIIDGIIGGLNTAIDAVNSHIPSIFGVKVFPSIPHIPMLAAGGPLDAGQMALVGERGPELFVPSSAGTVIPNNALGGGAGAGPVNIHLQVDGKTFASVILPSLQSQVLQTQRSLSVPVFGTVQ